MASGPDYPQIGGSLGRYRLVEELGRGGMAVVFRAIDPTLDRAVAIKILHQHLWNEAEYVTRFVREAQAVARLRHPNIVEVFDFGGRPGEEGKSGQPGGYIVAELITGPTLRQFVQQRGTPLPDVAVMIGIKLAEALGCAHGQGVIHRDLKPENIMLAEGGRVVLTDFGIARIVEGESVTQTGVLLGSPAYMSPEQARGEHVDPRSDLFSLGTVLYQLCTGRLPFVGKDPIATVLKILEGKPMPPQACCPQVSTQLDGVIMRLLQPSPDARFASAAELAEELRGQLSEIGLHDVDEELARYFADPGPYNRTLVDRVVRTSLDLASEAVSHRAIPRALDLCNRVLALSADHPEALALIKRMSGRRRFQHLLGAALVVLAAGVSALALWPATPARKRAPDSGASKDLATQPARAAAAADMDLADADGAAAVRDATARLDLDAAVRRPAIRRDRRRRSPRARDAAPLPLRPDVSIKKSMDAAARQPTTAQLLVAVGPWCDAFIDGRAVGRSPMTRPIRVAPGKHQLVCRQGKGGPVLTQWVVVAAGETRKISGLLRRGVEVRVQLSRGDAIRLDGKQHDNGARLSLAPSRYRFDILKKGRVVTGGWVAIPATGCVLVDLPSPRCR